MKPYYEASGITIYHGDCREVLPALSAEVVVTDPPYAETSLKWDRWPDGWVSALPDSVRSMWCFGSLAMFLDRRADFSGWSLAQEVVWEKHNGSNAAADRFRRVHELAVQWYRGPWANVFKEPQFTADATKRQVRRKQKPTQWGAIDGVSYESIDGGPRQMRSVLQVRSCHGYAEHPTQKPLGILSPLIAYSAPVGGLVLDPFAGSGSTLVAAREANRRAIGIELEERYCEIAAQRLSQEVLDFGGAA
jgi:site-specific DNA-methyltransferase (adenine-specific)